MQHFCRQCQQQFDITPEDLAFYDKVSPVFNGKKELVPSPTFCRDCRLQRRLTWRNERCFYQRTCGLCGRNMVSIHAVESPFPVYCNKCWWSDACDGKNYGRVFDFSHSFFGQFQALRNATPQITLMNDDGVGSENCTYCQDYAFGKNCYYMIGSWESQNSYYCTESSDNSRHICDCTHVSNSELVYGSIDSRNLYHCAFLQDCENSSDCWFGFDLKGCRNCFCCINLRQKEFHIFNEPYSEEEYRKKIATFRLGSHQAIQELHRRFQEWILTYPRKNMFLSNCENSEGNHLFNSKDTFGFNAFNAEHCKFYDRGNSPKFTYDVFQSGRNLWCYEGMVPDDSYMALFCLWCWKCKNILYSDNCHNCEQCFGCVGLKRAKYCILNKQYSKEDYERIVPQIIAVMRGAGEWGEFFPTLLSSHAYNETIAPEYFPLTKEQVLAQGWRWREEDRREYRSATADLPDDISDSSDEIAKAIFACDRCRKNYRIIPQELALYRNMPVPAPRCCSACRHTARQKLRTPYKLWERSCAKCAAKIKTAYAPERPEIVYCEECYLKEVY
ncbi:MAG: hypothetical protein PHW10_05370 [Candidatus Peribacteraceae bacterium]|nr:hypothetical protein [Candidatus Peribacteraceae bacterium]